VVEGRAVLIVDDVMTTGATIAECGRALHEHGASLVVAATVAATRRRAGGSRGTAPEPHDRTSPCETSDTRFAGVVLPPGPAPG
jgi:orotate phosphoribosyltransferase